MSRAEKEALEAEQRSRAFWDHCAADEVMSVIKHGLRSDVWRDGLMEVHLHLVYHFAHEENERLDFYARHKIRDDLQSTSSRGRNAFA